MRKLFMVALFLLAQALFGFSELFHLGSLTVVGNGVVTRDRILARARIEPGTPVWLIHPGIVADRVAALHELERVDVQVRLPGKLDIQVKERSIAYVVTSRAQPTRCYAVDANGVVLRQVALPTRLPFLEIDEPLVLGGRLSQGVLPIARETLAVLGPVWPSPATRISIDKMETVTVHTSFRGAPVTLKLGTLDQRDYKKHLLQALLVRLEKEQRPPILLDLRYSSPILKLAPAPRDEGEGALESP